MSAKKKAIREAFNLAVFKRDKHKCVFCDCTENLDAHHITDRNLMPKGGYVKENGITLCSEHHEMAEEWHRSEGRSSYPGFTPAELYEIIGSSYEIAVEASKRL